MILKRIGAVIVLTLFPFVVLADYVVWNLFRESHVTLRQSITEAWKVWVTEFWGRVA